MDKNTLENKPVVEVDGLCKGYRELFKKEVKAVQDVSFSIKKGEAVAFLGPNGAGKTTTIKLMLGLLTPDKGTVKNFGESLREIYVKKKIGYLPENPSFYRFLTGRENILSLSRMVHKKDWRDDVERILKKVKLGEVADRRVNKYSRGMVQRLGIAQALIHNPELLILDEPLSGLDPMGRKEIRDLIVQMKDEGTTIFFSTHILPDIEPFADRILVINKGKIVASPTVSELDDIEDYLMGILK